MRICQLNCHYYNLKKMDDLNLQQTNVLNFLSKMSSKTIFTLVFIKRNTEVLLGLKTRGFGVGLWNGFGGKVQGLESVLDGAKRELMEESNLEAPQLKHLGVVTYKEQGNLQESVVHIFTANYFKGRAKASEEMNPIKWYSYTDIPYKKMWPDAEIWYPLMLSEKYFAVEVMYGSDGKIKHTNVQNYFNVKPNILQF